MVQTHEQLSAANYYIGNNVEVSPDVVIAAGAVLDAAPGSRLTIEAGVCIGSGVVIQVYGGDLTLAAGVSLGKEVLLVGTGRVGTRACIGAESTLINPQVEADAVVPARSLIGDNGQALPNPPPAEAQGGDRPVTSSQNGKAPDAAPSPVEENGASESPDQAPEAGTLAATNMVYGREQVMQLVKTLFPHRDLLNGNNGNSS